jgi:RimJ/RimL family protein N-acetyltransferase
MDQFKEIIDAYIENYNIFEKGKVNFDCDYGELIFYKENDNLLVLHGIYIFPQYRNKGLCRDILYYLIDQCTNKFKYFCVQSVISKILYNYLLRFKYKNKKFKNTKSGFVYVIKN